ncbi:MAG: hypothetical protein R2774_03420 [Saprospiraceae bacterium]
MANNTGKKYGGREAGTPNKLTKELRSALKNILNQEIELLPEHFNKLETKDRLEILVKLLPYAMPKVEPESYEISEGGFADSWG